MPLLPVEEYVEQAYLFKALAERLHQNEPIQELLKSLQLEILATTNLPKAISFILDELNHIGTMSTAMRRMPHYFAAFQSYLMEEAERERGRFDAFMAFTLLHHEAAYRAGNLTTQGLFFFQFEILCRNKLDYDKGLVASAQDPAFNRDWSRWILDIRHKLGIVDIADLVYVHSEYYRQRQASAADDRPAEQGVVLFGEKEGRIALANRRLEPLHFFAALQRQLHYPPVPRPPPRDSQAQQLTKLARLIERLEVRVKLLEDEQRETGIDLTRFYERPGAVPPPPDYPDEG